MGTRRECDVLVIGAGIAGLTSAIHLADAGRRVIVLNRAFDPEESNTRYAQGGIIWFGEDDSPELLAGDIEEAGDGIGFERAIEILVQEGPPLVEKFLIERLRVPFDRDKNGDIHKTREAAHSSRRIIHVGDHTGADIQTALTAEAKSHPNIVFLAGFTAVDLVSTTHHSKKRGSAYVDTRILGAYVLNRETGEIETILASYTLVATGGVGEVYLYTTNPEGARGDGIAMASLAGAHVINMEYVQFHPTAFRKVGHAPFLISEAVRGEGAILVDQNGERFMAKYRPDLMELAPRDEVARAIFREMRERSTENVWLDCRPIAEKGIDLEKRFPKIFATCLASGIDIRRDPIPVAPAAHYLCGGIRVDEWGRTNLLKLYAAGEASCTGLHGANRLASTSLLEGLVWGKRVAENISAGFEEERFEDWEIPDWDDSDVTIRFVPQDFVRVFTDCIREIMWNNAGIVRSEKKMAAARSVLADIQNKIEELYDTAKLSDELIGARNVVIAAELIVQAARRNKVSKGCHFREDRHPDGSPRNGGEAK